MKKFEMARSDNPEEMIKASQLAVLSAMEDLIKDLKNESKAPGLTWEQIQYLIDKFKEKEPEIFYQREEI